MAIPLSMLPDDLLYKGQLDVSNPVKQAKYNQLNQQYEQSNNNNGGGGGGGGGFQPLSAADYTALEQKIYLGDPSKPGSGLKDYYMQLLKEANGDLDRAKAILHEDYTKGVRVATENYNTDKGYALGSLKNTLDNLGINFQTDQENAIDNLNHRGAAVYESTPGGGYNVVKPTLPPAGSYNPASANLATLDPNNPDNSGINPLFVLPNGSNLGQGGVELERLTQDQQLRQEALQRAANKNLQDIGVTFTRATNPTATDKSQQGSLELAQSRGIDTATRQRQLTGEELSNQLQNEVMTQTNQLAGAGQKAAGVNTDQLFNTQEREKFVNTGL